MPDIAVLHCSRLAKPQPGIPKGVGGAGDASATHTIRSLEERLGVRPINRTTRAMV